MIGVRAAIPDDVPLILELVKELAAYERAEDEVVAVEADLRAALFSQTPSAAAQVGLLDSSVVGFALWFVNFSTWLGRPGMYLEDLFVRPQARGRGLGRALLASLAQIAVDRGYGRLDWAVLSWNAPAIGFYRRLGASEVAEWRTYRLSGQALAELASSPAAAGMPRPAANTPLSQYPGKPRSAPD